MAFLILCLLFPHSLSLTVISGGLCQDSTTYSDATEFFGCDYSPDSGPLPSVTSSVVLVFCKFHNFDLATGSATSLVEVNSVTASVGVVSCSFSHILGHTGTNLVSLTAASVYFITSVLSNVTEARVGLYGVDVALWGNSFDRVSNTQSIVNIAKQHFWGLDTSFTDCQMCYAFQFQTSQESTESLQFVNISFVRTTNLGGDAQLIKEPPGLYVAFSNSRFEDTFYEVKNTMRHYYVGCDFVATVPGETALRFGQAEVWLAGCSLSGFAIAAESLWSGTVFKACQCNFSDCANPIQMAVGTIGLYECQLTGISACAIDTKEHYGVDLTVSSCLFVYVAGQSTVGIKVPQCSVFTIVNSSFVSEGLITIGLVWGDATCTISGCCFSAPNDNLVVTKSNQNQEVVVSATFASTNCLAGFRAGPGEPLCGAVLPDPPSQPPLPPTIEIVPLVTPTPVLTPLPPSSTPLSTPLPTPGRTTVAATRRRSDSRSYWIFRTLFDAAEGKVDPPSISPAGTGAIVAGVVAVLAGVAGIAFLVMKKVAGRGAITEGLADDESDPAETEGVTIQAT